MRAFHLVWLIAASLGTLHACGTPPSISSLTPAEGYFGREYDVVLAGSATRWGANAQASFGEGVTVVSVTSQSANRLVAHIKIAADALEGSRDVVVSEGGSKESLSRGFAVRPPLTASIEGPVVQGTRFKAYLTNADWQMPLKQLEDVEVSAPGIMARVVTVARNTAEVEVLSDVHAVIGPFHFELTARDLEHPLRSQTVTMLARDAKAVVLDTLYSSTIAHDGDTGLFSVSPQSGSPPVVLIPDVRSEVGSMGIVAYGSNGLASEAHQANDGLFLANPERTYFQVIDEGNEYGRTPLSEYPYSMQIHAAAAPRVIASTVALPSSDLPVAYHGQASIGTTWIPIEVGANDLGKRLRVRLMNAAFGLYYQLHLTDPNDLQFDAINRSLLSDRLSLEGTHRMGVEFYYIPPRGDYYALIELVDP